MTPLALALSRLDTYGESEPMPKSWCGGILSIVSFIAVGIYAVSLYVQYKEAPPTITSEAFWSTADGPYPIPFACQAERCWISSDFEAEVHGMSAQCVKKLNASQHRRCLSLRQGDRIDIQACYSQLPKQAIHVHFVGGTAWDSFIVKTGLHDDAAGALFGTLVWSDMQPMNGEKNMIPMATPIRAGVVLMKYVRTQNLTVATGQPGNLRHEWFSRTLATSVDDSEFEDDPCLFDDFAGAFRTQELHRSVLVIDADFTQITVTPLSNFFLAAFGELGGALELLNMVLLVVLLASMRLPWIRSKLRHVPTENVTGAPAVADYTIGAGEIGKVREI